MSAKKLRWRIVYNSWDSARAAVIKTRYPDRRHDKNGWLEWYEVDFHAHGDNGDGGFNPNPDAWYACYFHMAMESNGVFRRTVEPRQTLYDGPSEEEAKAACNEHYNRTYFPPPTERGYPEKPKRQPTVKVVTAPEPTPVAGRIRLNVRHEAGLEGIQALIALEKSLHGHNVHIDAIYEGEDEWYAYGMISYPDPAAPLANREVPPKIVTLADRPGRRRGRRSS
jgi:hypothetical protein